VDLLDVHDNDGLGQGACEAIYARTVLIDVGATLNTNCSKVYYVNLTNNGAVDNPANLIPINCAPPALVTVCPDLGTVQDYFIDPKAPSTGGLTAIEIQLDQVVAGLNGAICMASTGGSPPATANLVRVDNFGLYEVQLASPIELAEWTTVTVPVESFCGVTADICFQVAWHPGDCNQDRQTNLADVNTFGVEYNLPPSPRQLELVDLDDNGQANLNDINKFGQIWNGTSGEDDPSDGLGWSGKGLPLPPPCACP